MRSPAYNNKLNLKVQLNNKCSNERAMNTIPKPVDIKLSLLCLVGDRNQLSIA